MCQGAEYEEAETFCAPQGRVILTFAPGSDDFAAGSNGLITALISGESSPGRVATTGQCVS